MRKILVVEDEPMLRGVYEMILSTEAYVVDVAANGKHALEKCVATEYDLVLLDLMMPVLDGNGFLEAFDVDAHERTKVIILSNLSAGKELTRALALGAHKNVLKSDLSPRQLLTLVRYELAA